MYFLVLLYGITLILHEGLTKIRCFEKTFEVLISVQLPVVSIVCSISKQLLK